MNIIEMDKDNILKQLEDLKVNLKLGYRIYFNDELLVMNLGKFVWNKFGEVKNVLIGFLKYVMGYYEYYEVKIYDCLIELLDLGIIRIEYYDGN